MADEQKVTDMTALFQKQALETTLEGNWDQ